MEYLILLGAGFGAGLINTMAGGGTFLTFPALVMTGVPPVVANATSAVVVGPGYLGGTLGFVNDLRQLNFRLVLKTSLIAVVGGLCGSLLLIMSTDALFSLVIPFLLLVATGLFAFGEKLQRWLKELAIVVPAHEVPGTFLVSVYGGYFNGGLGIVLLGLFTLWGMTNLNEMNGLKNFVSLVLSVASFGFFAIVGLVAWPQALTMMLAAILGGYCGAPLARALPSSFIRFIIVVIGLSMSTVFFVRAFD